MEKSKSEFERVYLHSLEVESGLDSTLGELSILAQGLFSPQVCLIDSHIADNKIVWDFFLQNERGLREMVDTLEPYELPLIGTCGRGGADCRRTLDIMLVPRDGKPPRLSSISPSQIERIAPGYDKLSEQQRRERFLHLKGPDEISFTKYLDVATEYFQSCTGLTVVSPKRPPDVSLYQEMKTLIDFLRQQPAGVLTNDDQRTCDALLNEISTNADGPKTRQRLHKTIYGEHFPPYHDGIVAWHTLGLPRDVVKDEWRFLVNDVYNENLARSFGLRSAQDFHPRKIRFEQVFTTKLATERTGLVKLASTIYPSYLSFDFVHKVRKQKQFWRNLSDPTLDPIVHRQYIAEEFARHLVDQGRKDLAGEQWREKILIPLKTARLAVPPIAAALVVFHGLGKGSTLETVAAEAYTSYKLAEGGINRTCRGIEDYFATGGREVGARWSYNADLKTFVDVVAETTRVESNLH
jgi:hypothetical protein